jgi:hypothetical protein
MPTLDREAEEKRLLAALHAQSDALAELLARCSSHWGYEDPIYRFYHQSFKVYSLQHTTQQIVVRLQALAPHLALHAWFLEIVAAGTGKEFAMEDNQRWTAATRPILEAFFHARYFLEMAVKYAAELTEPPQPMPSGWAAFLYLYNLR